MKPYAPYLAILEDIRTEKGPALLKKHGLQAMTGEWLDCAVLKLQKDAWTDGGRGQGVFFSVWIGEKELKKQRFNYNIHALKLRLRKGYAIKPGEFTRTFRAKLDPAPWPNVSVDYGPQTLMQGWLPADLKTFRREVAGLMKSFVAIHAVIDEMLEERRILPSLRHG